MRTRPRYLTTAISLLAAAVSPACAQDVNVTEPPAQAIDWVWSGQRVWFDFVSQGDHQMVAYYDANRQMSVAVRQMRDINGAPWKYHKIDSFLGWDAHNAVEAAFDEDGHIHVIGNMHGDPLTYFRSREPYDPRTLERIDIMAVRADERQMTYPSFFTGNQGALYFKYRDGTSGQGRWFYNVYDADAQTWSHLHDTVLLDGEGVRGVYPLGPVFGPDGYAHLTFVWRETSRASSNHDLSYARSKDLVSWETSSGQPIALPITLGSGEIIDPIPEHGGLLNGRTPIGFDEEGRVLVTYQKYDEAGDTQVYLARREAAGWREAQISTWQGSRVDLDKSGALDLPIVTDQPARLDDAGRIVVPATWRDVLWEWVVDPITLTVVSGGVIDQALPDAISRYDRDDDAPLRVIPMMVDQVKPSTQYFASWEAMQPNRDQARPDIPEKSTLRVHRVDPSGRP